MSERRSVSVCGRRFTPDDLAWLDALPEQEPGICRAEITRRLWARLPWRSPGGPFSARSARVPLRCPAARGRVCLPPPELDAGGGRAVESGAAEDGAGRGWSA